MRYYEKNGIKIIECKPKDVRFSVVNERKKNIKNENTYVNLGYFAAGFIEEGESFVLPAGHFCGDIDTNSKMVNKYLNERTVKRNGTYQFDSYHFANAKYNQFYNKPVDVFAITTENKPVVERITSLPNNYKYACAGIRIMKNGVAAKYTSDVKNCGWFGSELYGTYHIFIGLKKGSDTIYVMNLRTKTGNMITSKEAYNKFKNLGFTDVMKFDGGGSEIMKYKGTIKHAMAENRRISNILVIEEYVDPNKKPINNPYPVPTRTLVLGCKGNDVKWLQYQLNALGFNPKGIDANFGPGCKIAVKNYQASRGLSVDGSVGPATRASLISERI